MWKGIILAVVLSIACTTDASAIRRSFLDNLNSGIKLAGQLFGFDAASDVADLVSQAFSGKPGSNKNFMNKLSNKQDTFDNTNYHPEDEVRPTQPTSIMNGVFRLLGLDGAKLGAIAVNGIIFIAKMIAAQLPQLQHLVEPQTSRSDVKFSPLDWILENKNVIFTKLLDDVRDKNLNIQLVKMIEDHESEIGEGDCIKLLMCKITPFLWSMQKSITDGVMGKVEETNEQNATETLSAQTLFHYLPDWKEFKDHGDACEEKYVACNIYE